ncbi:MAG: DUF2247 family protein [Xanthomonadales bacterium]|nr:DUF2247 family protein [Xanthomonadales bacterium]
MDLVRLRIPYEFVCERTRPSWRDIRFGLLNELLDPKAPVALAIEQVGEVEVPAAALVELAGAGENEPTSEQVRRLADSEPLCSEGGVRAKWLYLVLAWVYEHRSEYSDPLKYVEEVYGDFGYPEQIESFVRNMPMVGPDLGSRDANERRLFERWKQYLDKMATIYSG